LADTRRGKKDSIWDETPCEGRQFRNRFTVPYEIFDDLVKEYNKIDPRGSHDLWSRSRSELRLLILGALRVLAQHLTFDLIEELNDNSLDKNNKLGLTHRDNIILKASLREDDEDDIDANTKQFSIQQENVSVVYHKLDQLHTDRC
jgi:hypothetical protein